MTYINRPAYLGVVKENAKIARNFINMGNIAQKEQVEKYAKHLENCIYHPTSGLLAGERYIGHHKDSYMQRLLNNPTVKYLSEILDNRIKELYPKTRKQRQYIIDTHRVSLEYVKPAKGYNFIDKIKILLKK
jgi:hypothetical protein